MMSFIRKTKALIILFILFSVMFLTTPVHSMRKATIPTRDLKVDNTLSERKLRFELQQRTSVKKLKIAKKLKEGSKIIPLNGTDYTFTVLAYQDGDTLYIAPKKRGEPIYAPKNCKELFCAPNLQEIDLEGLDTSESVNMNMMFYYCKNLKTLKLGNKFNTSKVTDMSYMFASCKQLHSLELGEYFDTSNVQSMAYMFADCQTLTSLDLKDHFYTGSVTNMESMFSGCFNITSLNLRNHFDISKAKEKKNAIFDQIQTDIHFGEHTIKSDTNGIHFERFFSLLQRANSGNADAMRQLGYSYCTGEHTTTNMNKALNFYKDAIRLGDTEAMVMLGDIYYNDESEYKDIDKAVSWYEQASKKKNVHAKIRLAKCYLKGKGKKKDILQAKRLYEELLPIEDEEALIGMGECCFDMKENKDAIYWYLRAISRGSNEAKFRLAKRYYLGAGVDINVKQALEYFREISSDADINLLHDMIAFYDSYRMVNKEVHKLHTTLIARHCFYTGLLYFGPGHIAFDIKQTVFALFECSAKLGYEDAARFLYACYWAGNEVKQDTLKAVQWLTETKKHSEDKKLQPQKSLIERIDNLFAFLNKERSTVAVFKYFEVHFQNIQDFLDKNKMVCVLSDGSVLLDLDFLEKMIDSNGIDIIKLKLFLNEAEITVEAFKTVTKNEDTVAAFEKINACIDKKLFKETMTACGLSLNDMFFRSYITSQWRTVPIPESSYTDEGIQINIFDTVLTDKDALIGTSNIYDYIFLDKGSWTKRFYKLEQCDHGQTRELLAREMYWLRVMTDRYKAGALDDRQKSVFEICSNLFKTHFLSATRACKNELANIIILWAKDIDDYEVTTGEGLCVSDQDTVDLFVQMSCRTYWTEKMVDYIELSKYKDDEDIGGIVKELMLCLDNETFGQEYKNYFRFIVAGFLNNIVQIGNNVAEYPTLTAKSISKVIAKMISLSDICTAAKKVYQSIADDCESIDIEFNAERKTLKEKLIIDIETQYEVSYVEFCTVVNLTCQKDFAKRFELFLESPDLEHEEDIISCLNDWKAGKINLTICKLTQCIFSIDIMLSNCDLIPELMRFTTSETSSSSENMSEYYSKILYPIYLLKTKMISSLQVQ